MTDKAKVAATPKESAPEDSDEDEGIPTKMIPETSTWKNKVCFFQISDLVEDRVRVRCLNIVAFSLVYIYFVLVLLQTVPKPAPQVKAVRFASPPPASWLSGELGDDLRGLYTGLGTIPNRSQKIFVVNDGRGPMPNVEVEVKVTNFVADGPLRCSKAQMDAMKDTVEARRLQHVCGYDRVQYNTGLTDDSGLLHLRNFTIDGPGGALQPVALRRWRGGPGGSGDVGVDTCGFTGSGG